LTGTQLVVIVGPLQPTLLVVFDSCLEIRQTSFDALP
jgi:hypothetical protein